MKKNLSRFVSIVTLTSMLFLLSGCAVVQAGWALLLMPIWGLHVYTSKAMECSSRELEYEWDLSHEPECQECIGKRFEALCPLVVYRSYANLKKYVSPLYPGRDSKDPQDEDVCIIKKGDILHISRVTVKGNRDCRDINGCCEIDVKIYLNDGKVISAWGTSLFKPFNPGECRTIEPLLFVKPVN